MMLFKYVLFGSLSGFFSSTPLGPINLWVADYKLSKSPHLSLLYFLAAVILVDMLFAGSALWGHFALMEESHEIRWTGILSGSFTVILGIILLYKAKAQKLVTNQLRQFRHWTAFLQGLLLTAANPAFIVFWIFVANQIMANLDQNLSTAELIAFVSGVLIGDVLWFTFFTWIISQVNKKSPASTLIKLRMAVGIIFIIIGLTGMASYVYK